MKTLCLFTNEFPYGSWEPYLETEIKYYSEFDQVYIFSLQLRKEHAGSIREVPSNCEVFPIPYAPKWKYLLYAFYALVDRNFYAELKELLSTKRFGLKQLVDLFVYISRSHYEMKLIFNKIKDRELGKTCFYSYRFEYQPYVALLLKHKLGIDTCVVSRAHRFDLYENKRPHKYIPCRKILLNHLDFVYPCSDDGTNYLSELFGNFKDKIATRFLGSPDHGIEPFSSDKKVFRIVSCSTVTPVKRIDLIVKALKLVNDVNIEWTHFGDGPQMDEVKALSADMPSNVKVKFMGNVPNRELLEIYTRESFDLFVNVSNSEGIPVSIMEALSFGIPCLATNAGGTGEIIADQYCGYLLPVDIDEKCIAQFLHKYFALSKEEQEKMRVNSRARWNEKFNAEHNYPAFVRELSDL